MPEARIRVLEPEAIEEVIRRQRGKAATAEGLETLGYGVGCTTAGGCSVGGSSYINPYELPRGYCDTNASSGGLSSQGNRNSLRLALDGSYVMCEPRLCPDGRHIGGGSCAMAPDGSYLGGPPTLSPDGSYVSGPPTLCPDGTCVGGTRCVMAPDGSYVGSY